MLRMLGISIGVILSLGLLAMLARMIALKRPPYPEPSTFFNEPFEVVAHRGGSLEAPENTLEAFEAASRIAPDMIFELDVHLTKDKQLVVIHDPTLERTTNGIGKVRDKTLENLLTLDAGYNFQDMSGEHTYRGKGIKIPTLESVIAKFPNRLIIEIKIDEKDIENQVSELVLKYKAEKRVMIGSQNGVLLNRFRKLNPRWNYSASRDDILRGMMLLTIYLEPVGSWPGNAYLIPEKDENIQVLTERMLAELKRRGKKVLIWTVNDEEDMKRLKSLGVSGLITDRPSVAYKLKSL